ncbi:hypothetical protein BJX68DRAFT_255566 [Aspergillus pseudodeflectus]|uniref:CBM-cenC domain-containing protein n=1 Tax=Aspergillus pseudodeflectus TaxID=176178 RepID=A0ABR4KAW4_9EURO
MGHFRTAAMTGALLLAGLAPTGSVAPWDVVKGCTAGCPGTPPDIVEDAENAHDGSWVLRQPFEDNIAWYATQPVTIESPGEPHNISLWYRYDSLPGITVESCSIAVRYGRTPVQNIGRSSAAPDAGWTQLSVTWTPTATEYTFYVAYGCNYTTLYFDDIQFWAPERETTCSTSTSTSTSTSSTTTSTTTTSTSTTVTSSSTTTTTSDTTTSSTTTSSTTTSDTTTSDTTTSPTTTSTSSTSTSDTTTTSTTTTSSTTSQSTSTFTTTTKPTCNPHHTKTITRTKTVTVTTCPTSLPAYFECLVDGIHHH